MRVPIRLTNGAWTKVEFTYNGGIATAYLNGRRVASASGAGRGSRALLSLGAVAGFPPFPGVIDELKIYRCERTESEVGPVARPVSQMVHVGAATNLVLEGSGPAGRPLTFAILPGQGPTNGVLLAHEGSPGVSYQAGVVKGPDRCTYTVSDGGFTKPPTVVAIRVVEPHWLSPHGGPLEPRDGSSPERAWAAASAGALDSIWRTNNFYDSFYYAPGEYQTRGWKYLERGTIHPGCKHIGAGSEGPAATTIKLVDVWSA